MDKSQRAARYALVARIPRSAEILIEDAFLSTAGITRPIMGFHITVAGPYVWRAERPDTVLMRLARQCRRTQPFTLAIGGAGTFDGEGSYAVYVHVQRSGPLLRLHRQVHGILRRHIRLQRELPTDGYLPHVTLGLGLTVEERDRALAALATRQLYLTVEIHELHLMEEAPGTPWRAVP